MRAASNMTHDRICFKKCPNFRQKVSRFRGGGGEVGVGLNLQTSDRCRIALPFQLTESDICHPMFGTLALAAQILLFVKLTFEMGNICAYVYVDVCMYRDRRQISKYIFLKGHNAVLINM